MNRQTLAQTEKMLGREHPDTLASTSVMELERIPTANQSCTE
jgi:hypothetical protein